MSQQYKKNLIVLSLIVGLVTFSITNYISLSVPTNISAGTEEYWRGGVDEKLRQGEERDRIVNQKLDEVMKEIRNICADITQVKVDAARNGALYGTASSVITLLVGLLIQTLARRKNGRKEG